MDEDDDLRPYSDARIRRIRVVAWTVIVALIVTGGGATALSLLFG